MGVIIIDPYQAVGISNGPPMEPFTPRSAFPTVQRDSLGETLEGVEEPLTRVAALPLPPPPTHGDPRAFERPDFPVVFKRCPSLQYGSRGVCLPTAPVVSGVPSTPPFVGQKTCQAREPLSEKKIMKQPTLLPKKKARALIKSMPAYKYTPVPSKNIIISMKRCQRCSSWAGTK